MFKTKMDKILSLIPGSKISKIARLPIGIKIEFLKALEDGPDDYTPGNFYAKKGQLGVIVGPGNVYDYSVKTLDYEASFGATLGEDFKVVKDG